MRRLLLLVLCLAAVLAGGLTAAVVAGGGPGRAVEAVEQVERRVAPDVPRVSCPSDADATCRAVHGRVVLVEAVDPDGDGDLHVVVADGSITAPGFTSVDVRPGLRPDRDPQVGDVVSAAGPVQQGSFGQAQIHALRFRAAR